MVSFVPGLRSILRRTLQTFHYVFTLDDRYGGNTKMEMGNQSKKHAAGSREQDKKGKSRRNDEEGD